MENNNKVLHSLACIIIILGITVTALGVFYTTGGQAFKVTNQYGDIVKMYGDGIYVHDSYFRAPIFRGSDCTILFVAIPLLVAALLLDIKRASLKKRLYLTSVISVFTYYSTSLAFGVTYNSLHLLYIAFFSASFFALVVAMAGINYEEVENSITKDLPYRGIYIFLALAAAALFIAWLPDIIGALVAHRSLAMIEVYTTEITYVLDMGIISPTTLICLYLLQNRKGMGYVLLFMLLTICMIIGIMLPLQTLFQLSAGIHLPLPSLLTKTVSFVVLAIVALYFNIRAIRSMNDIKY